MVSRNSYQAGKDRVVPIRRKPLRSSQPFREAAQVEAQAEDMPAPKGSKVLDETRSDAPGGHFGEQSQGAQGASAGRICFHIHHHHYWLLKDFNSTPIRAASRTDVSATGTCGEQQEGRRRQHCDNDAAGPATANSADKPSRSTTAGPAAAAPSIPPKIPLRSRASSSEKVLGGSSPAPRHDARRPAASTIQSTARPRGPSGSSGSAYVFEAAGLPRQRTAQRFAESRRPRSPAG